MKKILFLILFLFCNLKCAEFNKEEAIEFIEGYVKPWESDLKKCEINKKFILAKLLYLSICKQFFNDELASKELEKENDVKKSTEFFYIGLYEIVLLSFTTSIENRFQYWFCFFKAVYEQLSDDKKKELISPKELEEQFNKLHLG